MLEIVHRARHGVLLTHLDERVAVVHRHAREHGDVEDADDAQNDGDSAGNRRLGRDITEADRRYGLKAKPEAVAKREGRGLGQPDGRRAQQIEDEKDRTEEIDKLKRYMETDEYTEEVAREKLGLVKDNETVFKKEQ